MERWIPLESNPEVFNSWSNKVGLVSSQAQFEDVYGLDPDALTMVSQPVKAVLLLFPMTDTLKVKRKEEDSKIKNEGQLSSDSTLFWIKQTISNACGTIGLLHALANSTATIIPESPLAKFIEECRDKSPEERAKHLEITPLFANIHAEAASAGQSVVPNNLDTNHHFTCFIRAPSVRPNSPSSYRVIELDGRRDGPIDRGECTDLLMDVAKIVKDIYLANSSSLQFSMITLGPPT